MIQHVALFKFKPEATPAQRQAMLDALNGLPALIAEIKRWKIVPSLPGRPARFYDAGVFAEFDDVAAVDRYLVHPDHLKVVPLVEAACLTRAVFNYE